MKTITGKVVTVAALLVWQVCPALAAPILIPYSDVSYTRTPTEHPTYFDTGYPGPAGGTKLSNGVIGTDFFNDSRHVAWSGASPTIIFDLGRYRQEVTQLDVYYNVNQGVGIHSPLQVAISFSTDGVSYSTPVNFSGFDNSVSSGIERLASISVSGEGRFVRTDWTGQGSWMFLSEVSFFGLPEPASAAMLLAGCGSMLRRRRR